MIRTQVYLTEREKFKIEQISKLSGRKQSDILREAVDQYIEKNQPESWKEKIQICKGLWENRADLPDFEMIRKESESRL